ncbi:MAG: DUF615 domain-containing protein [Desulfovibrionaceae bacterium]|nr:DUF615 domain-containing protein [Desulfovibrionaceae bacterium]
MSRKPPKGYFVRGQFVAEGSEADEELKREQRGDGPSKTELKAHSAELQALGEQLLTLRAGLLEPLALPARLLDALQELGRIGNFEGRRRQSQFVGKLMRQLPEEQIEAIRAALDEQQKGSVRDTLRLHAAERWRERLVADNAAVSDWAAQFPATDMQQLRALVRQARKDALSAPAAGQAQRHGRAYRELFQLVRDALERAESHSPRPLAGEGLGERASA